jgi:hypothetical protein
MNRVARDIDRGARAIDGIQVQITEVVWADRSRNFEIRCSDTGADLNRPYQAWWRP